MNGRIKQLMDRAGIDVEAVENLGEMPTALKFAELIVKECTEQVWYTREDMINDNISEVIKLRIKEHFGVEK
jgi:hypothetical protein